MSQLLLSLIVALKVVGVAYERRLLTKGFKYSDLTRKPLVFKKTGRCGGSEVVATEGSTPGGYSLIWAI